MQKYLGLTHRFLLFTTSCLASSVLLTSPSQAATIALSEGKLFFTNFSSSPTSTFTNTDTNATSIFEGGNVATKADAITYLGVTPPLGYSISSSQAFGEYKGYTGLANSKATIQGIFEVDKNFSFNFSGDLKLATFTNNPHQGSTSANGNFGFALINLVNNKILDYFQISGSLKTGNNDGLTYQSSNNVKFSALNSSHLGGEQEFYTANFEGSLNHYFNDKTTIALVVTNSTEARVSVPVPTPSMLPGVVLSWVVIILGIKRKHIKNNEPC